MLTYLHLWMKACGNGASTFQSTTAPCSPSPALVFSWSPPVAGLGCSDPHVTTAVVYRRLVHMGAHRVSSGVSGDANLCIFVIGGLRAST